MPNTDLQGAQKPLSRIHELGLGQRPDKKPVTASIGVSERELDSVDSWDELVERADHRMYMAKQTGKDRIITEDIQIPLTPSI
jgi:PleD family two-component response regulator